jgi:hypothetical protein
MIGQNRTMDVEVGTVHITTRKPITSAEWRSNISGETLRHVIWNMESVKSIHEVPAEAERAAVDLTERGGWDCQQARKTDESPRQLAFSVDDPVVQSRRIDVRSR